MVFGGLLVGGCWLLMATLRNCDVVLLCIVVVLLRWHARIASCRMELCCDVVMS